MVNEAKVEAKRPLARVEASWAWNPKAEGLGWASCRRSQFCRMHPRLVRALCDWDSGARQGYRRPLLIETAEPWDGLARADWWLRQALDRPVEPLLLEENQAWPLCRLEAEFAPPARRTTETESANGIRLCRAGGGTARGWSGALHAGDLVQPSLLLRARQHTLVSTLGPILRSGLWAEHLFHTFLKAREDWEGVYEEARKSGGCLPRLPSLPVACRWILLGTPEQLGLLRQRHPEFCQSADWVALESEYLLTPVGGVEPWCRHVEEFLTFHDAERLRGLPTAVWKEVVRWGQQETQDLFRLPLHLGGLLALLNRAYPPQLVERPSSPAQAKAFSRNESKSLDLSRAMRKQRFEQNYWQVQGQQEFLSGQCHLGLTGQEVGQVYGLAVSQTPMETEFGLPFRLTCVAYHGEGELQDVDGKVGMGGALHLKGMAILQAYLRSQFQLEHTLPLAASVVSEQSYEHFDGDSASLAEFCCWFSALAEIPLEQGLAVTGSMDQRGRVQSVGGIPTKILGFWQLCRHLSWPSGCGVMFPASNCQNLVLPSALQQDYFRGRFRLVPVRSAMEALRHLTGKTEGQLRNRLKTRLQKKLEEEVGEKTSSFWHRFWPGS